jgi:hypothetical protein
MSAPHEHGDAAEELRLLVIALLDRLQPGVRGLLAAMREVGLQQGAQQSAEHGTEQAGQQPVACGWCPLCSAIALVRGERPELAARIAEHADGLLLALRAVLEQPVAEPPGTAAPRPPRVQRIVVREPAVDGGC